MNQGEINARIVEELVAERDKLLAIIARGQQMVDQLQAEAATMQRRNSALMLAVLVAADCHDLNITPTMLRGAHNHYRLNVSPAEDKGMRMQALPKDEPREAEETPPTA